MKTNYYKFVASQKMAKSILIAGHLWLEHVLVRSISAILPNHDALFKERSVNFHMLVSLCEAHGIIEPPLAVALRRINALRNKCAHRATYELLDDPELNALWSSVREIGDANTLPELSDFDGAIEATAILLERRARAVGATDLEAIVPEIPDYVLRHLEA
ncbi:MAG: hypothetical protein WAV20_17730 [Blastocatellia bacterium]